MTPRAGKVNKKLEEMDLPENMFPKKERCDRCGYEMEKITACHLLCPNCGVNYDCSDKGNTW